MTPTTRRIRLSGTVQGCGFRPALARLAQDRGWSGSVRNTPAGLELILDGLLPPEEQLREILAQTVPAGGRIEDCVMEFTAPRPDTGFQILESEPNGPRRAPLPRDRAVCPACLSEFHDPANRRYHYPFITCAECGPRYSLLESMPFDRDRTTMRDFPLCQDCLREFHDVKNRRFHAQTISCAACGPRLWARRPVTASSPEPAPLSGLEAILRAAVTTLSTGGVVAMKGIGGFQLLADARSVDAVQRVRTLKGRPSKPLAVLCRTIEVADRLARLNTVEAKQLTSAENPIVLLRQAEASGLAPNLNPGLNEIGVLLPSTALHDWLLQECGRALVCTSGNREGDPLIWDETDPTLEELADLVVGHNRRIAGPIDDSVVRVMANQPMTIRAARGLAPVPLAPIPVRPAERTGDGVTIACGGHQKSAVVVSNGTQAILSPHLGDLDTLRAAQHWTTQCAHLLRLLGVSGGTEPQVDQTSLICDAHPGYVSSRWASQQSPNVKRIWHHHAHCMAGLMEQGWPDREVLGVAWDGTGLGPDGTLWGGEFLLATPAQFDRISRFRPFRLPGGERAIRDIQRIAFSLLSHCPLDNQDLAAQFQFSGSERSALSAVLNSSFSPWTSSVGRLLDGCASLILDLATSDYEGAAAQRLEAVCDVNERAAYPFAFIGSAPIEIDWRPVVHALLEDRRAGVGAGSMAMRLHRGLANAILTISTRYPEHPVVLSGGCFQNRVLVELLVENWPISGPPLGRPGRIPVNDGGLACGQWRVGLDSR